MSLAIPTNTGNRLDWFDDLEDAIQTDLIAAVDAARCDGLPPAAIDELVRGYIDSWLSHVKFGVCLGAIAAGVIRAEGQA